MWHMTYEAIFSIPLLFVSVCLSSFLSNYVNSFYYCPFLSVSVSSCTFLSVSVHFWPNFFQFPKKILVLFIVLFSYKRAALIKLCWITNFPFRIRDLGRWWYSFTTDMEKLTKALGVSVKLLQSCLKDLPIGRSSVYLAMYVCLFVLTKSAPTARGGTIPNFHGTGRFFM